jgi:lysozyme
MNYKMKISQTGIDLIKSFEGLRLEAYLCSSKVATIGFGSTYYADLTPVKLGDKLKDKQQAEDLFKLTLKKYEDSVNGLFFNVILNQNQFDALVSFAYNVGPGALAGSTLYRKAKINTKDESIALEFAKWNLSGGKKSTGLTRRRKAESKLYFM